MTVPAPLVPDARPLPVLPYPLEASPDGLNGFWVDSPAGRVGRAFPPVVAAPDGRWFTKQPGVDADVHLGGMVAALAYLCGCDPADIRFEEAL